MADDPTQPAAPSPTDPTLAWTGHTSDAPAGLPGSTIGKYRIASILGRGGTGTVYEAVDPLVQRRVAAKQLPDAIAHDRQALDRFLAEARAAGRVNHPNVVAVYEVDQQGGSYYLVTEFVGGGSIANRVAARGRLPWREATGIVIDACKGVAAAHAAGLTHGDLRPANLLLTHEGTVKVADFGLAKAAGTGPTQPGTVFGTPHFMAPEQCEGRPADARADIYALAATWFTLLTGRPPFADGGPPMQTMYAPLPPAAAQRPGRRPRHPAAVRDDPAPGDGESPGRPLPGKWRHYRPTWKQCWQPTRRHCRYRPSRRSGVAGGPIGIGTRGRPLPWPPSSPWPLAAGTPSARAPSQRDRRKTSRS